MKSNLVPKIHMPRSSFDLSHKTITSFNEGQLIPVLLQEVYPGDSFKDKTTFVIRTSTQFVKPIMDNVFLDLHFFFVPNRLVYDDWQKVMGENTSSYWAPVSTSSVPQINISAAGMGVGNLADYFGLGFPAAGNTYQVNLLPFRGYALIYNDWFRNENIQSPVYIDTSYSTANVNNNAFSTSNIFGKPANVNKFKDYFTSCLPAPQKGDPISIFRGMDIPVIPKNDSFTLHGINPSNMVDLKLYDLDAEASITTGKSLLAHKNGSLFDTSSTSFTENDRVVPENLFLAGEKGPTVNDLRFAFALQRMLEKDARGGTRYTEMIYEHFGVENPDARMQRSEYLGGKRIPLNISQVASTAGANLGDVGAFSLTSGQTGFTKGFTEHGFIFGLLCVRHKHTYSNNVEKFWFRKDRYDYYDPSFAYIGEQPVYKGEIFAANTGLNSGVFGYNEAYADLRFRFNKVTGSMRPGSGTGLDLWHLADAYANAPTLSSQFITEDNTRMDSVLSGGSAINNFIIDIYHDLKAARVLPVRGVPGFVDHI